MTSLFLRLVFVISLLFSTLCIAADSVPTEIQMPGTQPNEVGNLESPDRCDNCHSGYNDADPEAEPATGWRGSAMGNASRDPIFWATLGVAEQDFDGSGDLCIRCHSAAGWYGGHSTPTDGSGIPASDDNGVGCDTCHTMTNTDNSEHQGVMNSPHMANCADDSIAPSGSCTNAQEGYYGSGMLSIWNGSDKLGPYVDADARHQFMQSVFHRDVDFCGSCHDVSNPAVGDLAPGNGAQHGAPHVVSSQDFNGDGMPNLGGPVEEKAAFNNPPYAYGVVERTFSEYKASAFPTTLVSTYASLPEDLKAGSIEETYQASLAAGNGGDYADGSPRYFSCQSCHMRPTVSQGANKNGLQVRTDLPRHDLTGGNYWIGDIIKYQDSRGHLRLGGDLSATQIDAIDRGTERAKVHLAQAGSLTVINNVVKVTNLTGHKLISGYPEGRRMWLNIKWYDSNNTLLREDGAYGQIGVTVANPAGGPDVAVESILDLSGANTKIYEAHYAMTQEWAERLITVGKSASMPLSFDRSSGQVDMTLGELAAQAPGTYHDTFHFVLNNHVSSDNRIPPYGMRYDVAKQRNALPVPENQYGNPGPGGTYQYFDHVALNPPGGAVYATIDLLYQGTSWEYIQFLNNANTRQNAFLADEGINMLEAWLNTGMAKPQLMASTTWGTPPAGGGNNVPVAVDDAYTTSQDGVLTVSVPGVLGNDTDIDGDALTSVLATSTLSGNLTLNADGSFSYIPNPGFTGADSFTYRADDGVELSAVATVGITVTATGGATVGVGSISTGYYQTTGKGGNKVTTFIEAADIPVGEAVVIRSVVTDSEGNLIEDATVTSSITGPESTSVTSGASDANGVAEATWNTTLPNRKGNGGTTPGTYIVTTTNVAGDWDEVVTTASFNLIP